MSVRRNQNRHANDFLKDQYSEEKALFGFGSLAAKTSSFARAVDKGQVHPGHVQHTFATTCHESRFCLRLVVYSTGSKISVVDETEHAVRETRPMQKTWQCVAHQYQ